MSKFRVGDLVVGTQNSPYGIANKDSICEILSIREDFYNDLYVRVVSHIYYKETLGEEYTLSSCYFNLYKEKTNFRRNKCTNSK